MKLASELNILLVEDDLDQLRNLKESILGLGIKDVNCAATFNDAADKLSNSNFDLVISDFYLDLGKTAVDLLVTNLNNNNTPFLIRSIEYSDKVLDQIIQYTNIDFQSKDSSEFDILKAIKILTNGNDLNEVNDGKIQDSFFVRQRENLLKVNVESIELIEVDGKYLDIQTIDHSKFIIRSSLNEFLKKMPSSIVRIRQDKAVNIKYVNRLNLEDMSIHSMNRTLSISRRFKSEFVDRFVLR